MGIPVGTKEIELELRYSAIEVLKNLTTGEIVINIPYQVGFFDENNKWVVVNADTITASKDAALILFGVTPTQIQGDATSPMGELINKLAYAIVSGQIKLTARVLVEAAVASDDSTTTFTSLGMVVKKADKVIYSQEIAVGTPSNEFPATLGATIEFSATGYQTASVTAPILQGDFVINSITLTPNPVTEDASPATPTDTVTEDPTPDSETSGS